MNFFEHISWRIKEFVRRQLRPCKIAEVQTGIVTYAVNGIDSIDVIGREHIKEDFVRGGGYGCTADRSAEKENSG